MLAIAKCNNRKKNIKKALELLRSNIKKSLKGKTKLFIKINTTAIKIPIANTHPEALEAVLEYFSNDFKKIIVGDSTQCFKTNKHPYLYLKQKYPNIAFSDLSTNAFDTKPILFKQITGRFKTAYIALPKKDTFTISLALPKSHDTVAFTGCSKNMFGCVVKNRAALHGLSRFERILLNRAVKGFKTANYNLLRVIEQCRADLAILDCHTGMEANGPIFGKKIKLGFAMASFDALKLDKFAAGLFSFDAPYLRGIESDSEILKYGFNDVNELKRDFKKHYHYKLQINSTNAFGLDIRFPFYMFRYIMKFRLGHILGKF